MIENDCSECGKNLINGDKCYCGDCYYDWVAKVEDSQATISNLEGKNTELQDKITAFEIKEKEQGDL